MKKYLSIITGVLIASSTMLIAENPTQSSVPKEHNLLLEGGLGAILATRHNFKIQYDDEVSGGCLPRPSKLRDKLELSLRRNHLGILPNKKGGLDDTLTLAALGFKAGRGYCAVSLTLTLTTWVAVNVPYAKGNPGGTMTLTPMEVQIGHYLLTGRRSGMQRRLEKVALELGDKLYLNIARSKDDIFRKFPTIRNNFENSLNN